MPETSPRLVFKGRFAVQVPSFCASAGVVDAAETASSDDTVTAKTMRPNRSRFRGIAAIPRMVSRLTIRNCDDFVKLLAIQRLSRLVERWRR